MKRKNLKTILDLSMYYVICWSWLSNWYFRGTDRSENINDCFLKNHEECQYEGVLTRMLKFFRYINFFFLNFFNWHFQNGFSNSLFLWRLRGMQNSGKQEGFGDSQGKYWVNFSDSGCSGRPGHDPPSDGVPHAKSVLRSCQGACQAWFACPQSP